MSISLQSAEAMKTLRRSTNESRSDGDVVVASGVSRWSRRRKVIEAALRPTPVTSLFLLFALLAASVLQAQSNSTKDFASLSAKANAARDANRLDEAATLYKQALVERPNWAEGWWSLGTIQYDSNNYSAAAKSFQKL